jgi:hypothetical protein
MIKMTKKRMIAATIALLAAAALGSDAAAEEKYEKLSGPQIQTVILPVLGFIERARLPPTSISQPVLQSADPGAGPGMPTPIQSLSSALHDESLT